MGKIISKWNIRRDAYWSVYDKNALPVEFTSSMIKPSIYFGTETIPDGLQLIYKDDLECSECGSSGWFNPRYLVIPEECEEDSDVNDMEDYLCCGGAPIFCPRCGAQMMFVEV